MFCFVLYCTALNFYIVLFHILLYSILLHCFVSLQAFVAACPPGCKKYSLCDDKTEKGLWVYVKYFQLGAVEIPEDVEDRFLRALTLKEEAAREILLQEAQVVRKTTEAEVIPALLQLFTLYRLVPCRKLESPDLYRQGLRDCEGHAVQSCHTESMHMQCVCVCTLSSFKSSLETCFHKMSY